MIQTNNGRRVIIFSTVLNEKEYTLVEDGTGRYWVDHENIQVPHQLRNDLDPIATNAGFLSKGELKRRADSRKAEAKEKLQAIPKSRRSSVKKMMMAFGLL